MHVEKLKMNAFSYVTNLYTSRQKNVLSVNLSVFDDQLLKWMREQNWTAAGANHICENTKQSFIIFPKEQINDL